MVTIALGSMIASVMVSKQLPLPQGVVAVVMLYALQLRGIPAALAFFRGGKRGRQPTDSADGARR